MSAFIESLVEVSEKIDAIGNEHALTAEELSALPDSSIADTGLAHVLELLLGLDREMAQELFHFCEATANHHNHPGTNMIRGIVIGAAWQREYGVPAQSKGRTDDH